MQGLLQLRTSSNDQAQLPASGLVAATGDQSSDSTIRIKARAFQPAGSLCAPQCRCICHNIRSFRSPSSLDGTIGALFMGYTGCPVGALRRCTETTCQFQSTFRAYFYYLFPSWFLAKALTITLMNAFLNEISISLTVRNVVSSGAEIFRFVEMNDVDGLRRLFDLGLASPNDSTESGQTALTVGHLSYSTGGSASRENCTKALWIVSDCYNDLKWE